MLRTWQPLASSHEGIMDQVSNRKIMIVSRDSHVSYLLQRFVRTSAYQVIPVNLSDDVLSLAQCEKPIAIVLEVDKPETIGLQTLRTLKADPDAGRIPVIVCSWLDDSARGLAEGAEAYVRMPVLYKEFGAALAAILNREENDETH